MLNGWCKQHHHAIVQWINMHYALCICGVQCLIKKQRKWNSIGTRNKFRSTFKELAHPRTSISQDWWSSYILLIELGQNCKHSLHFYDHFRINQMCSLHLAIDIVIIIIIRYSSANGATIDWMFRFRKALIMCSLRLPLQITIVRR